MKLSSVTLNALALVAFTACATTRGGPASLEIRTHTAGEAGFKVNSHLILGQRDALLVDAQFTRSEAQKVVEAVKTSGRELKTIFITHDHPDHYLGLEVLTKAFPEARVLASPEVVAEIRKTAEGKREYWKGMYKDDLADKVVYPEPFSGKSLNVDGVEIELVAIAGAESAEAIALSIPSQGALLTGDLAYNQVHLWLAEGRPEGWLKALKSLKSIEGLKRIYPGHGAVEGVELLSVNEAYIAKFLEITSRSADAKVAAEALKKAFPQYSLGVIADLSTQAAFAK